VKIDCLEVIKLHSFQGEPSSPSSSTHLPATLLRKCNFAEFELTFLIWNSFV
jgi:hypothetical protein